MISLSKKNIAELNSNTVQLPSAASFDFPEKVLQFGTGVLLRGLPDYFIDKANQQEIFEGRIVVVKSTSSSGADAFSDQDGLYTICEKGIEDGQEVERYYLNNSISRVLAAKQDWQEVLEVAKNPELKVVISNTTEVGIVPSQDRLTTEAPDSFPCKLLAVLYQRFTYFDGAQDKGLVIVPTELISDNAQKLKSIVLDLAALNALGADFVAWLESANDFCNTLVDRIVPGALPEAEKLATEQLLGYTDQLMIMAEPFRLWAIESSSPRVAEVLRFAEVDAGMFLTPSIDKFKEIKLRLLNGTHTLSCAAALLAGFKIVKDTMNNSTFSHFVNQLMHREICPAIIGEKITEAEAADFASKVVDRFSNPFLDHKWASISLNYTSKMEMRVVPLIGQWYTKNTTVPAYLAFGFAAYVLFMDSKLVGDKYVKEIGGELVELQDSFAPQLQEYWKDSATVVQRVLSDTNLWGTDLTQYAGFEDKVQGFVNEINNNGALATVERI